MLPFISVILPVRNEREMLPHLIDELLQQSYPADRFEILVVDGRSTDGTPDLVRRRYAESSIPVRVIDNPKIRSGPARNEGVRAAAGDVVVFIDGHCTIPSRNLLADTARILEETGAACLCRPQPLIAPSATHTGEVIANARANWLGHGRDSLIYDMKKSGFVDPASSGATYLRSVFERVGFYDEGFDACEDVDFNTRVRQAGFKAFTDPRLAVYYQPRATLGGLVHQMIRYGRGRVRLMRKHADSRGLGQLAPLVILAALVAAPLAWFALPHWMAAVVSIPAAVFLSAVLVASAQLAKQYGLLTGWKAPWVFIAIYAGLGAGLLMEFVTPARKPSASDLLHPGQDLRPIEETDRAA